MQVLLLVAVLDRAHSVMQALALSVISQGGKQLAMVV